MSIEVPYRHEMEFAYGDPAQVSPLIRRIVAPNPSAFTLYGTNTYLVGRGLVAVIDPGPAHEEHLAALASALDGETVTHILVTHTHLDHSPTAQTLAEHTGAPTLGFGPHGGPGPEIAFDEGVVITEGGDLDFVPDEALRHGDRIEGPDWHLTVVHTPGHTSNHLCFALAEERSLFTGDHVMGWSTSVVIPPDGEMDTYLESLRLLLERDDAVLWPGHGPAIDDPGKYLTALLAHRAEREAEILEFLERGPARIGDMVPVIYAAVDPRLHPAAGLSVLAHLIALAADGRVRCDGEPGLEAEFEI